MADSNRHRERLLLGPGAILTVNEAASLLPIADSEARSWLRAKGLVRSLEGRPIVLWRDVLDAFPGPDDAANQAPVARSLPRRKLTPI